ncbi:RGG repeats nuclear RNA binding protein A-like [Typha latifolia]|uniref:RGG repeats nuclear RNA binding protein A-like n=1 Tax=Typha latifolia TaxID=4733 RepID=UPI003C303BFE
MTLSEYEKMIKERKKSLEVLKREERKVVEDQFHGMLPIQRKKEDGYSVKLSFENSKQKEKNVCKSISINHFLKPKEDEDIVRPLPTFGRGAILRGGLRANSSGRGRVTFVPNFDDDIHFPALKTVDNA